MGEGLVRCDESESIGSYKYAGMKSLRGIIFPDNIKHIGDHAFDNCVNLSNVSFPDGLKSIGRYAFNGCSSILEISIPDSVNYIGEYAFCDCYSLSELVISDCLIESGFRNIIIEEDKINDYRGRYYKELLELIRGGEYGKALNLVDVISGELGCFYVNRVFIDIYYKLILKYKNISSMEGLRIFVLQLLELMDFDDNQAYENERRKFDSELNSRLLLEEERRILQKIRIKRERLLTSS